MKYKAVIFDLDGTVVADEDEYGEAFNKVLKRFGVETGKSYPHVAGIGVEENWKKFREKYKSKINKSVEELTLATQQEYRNLIHKVRLKNGFIEFVEEIRDRGMKTALATSNSWSVTDELLETLDISKYFDHITTAEEVDYKKPDPQVFEISVEKLGEVVEECIVFEDSRAGIEAAKALGMKVVAFYRSEEHKKALKKADFIITDFTEFELANI